MRINIISVIGFLMFCLPGFLVGQTIDWSLKTPELGGTLRIGVVKGEKSLWFSDFSKAKKKSSDKEETFTLKDAFIEKGEIKLIIRPLKDSKGGVMKLSGENLPEGIRIIWAYGGASNMPVKTSHSTILPEDCSENVFSIEGNSFTLYYGTSRKLKILEALTPPGESLRLADARKQELPLKLLNSGKKTDAQVLTSEFNLENQNNYYFCFYFLNPKADYNYFMLPKLFEDGFYRVNKDTKWMKSTPD